MSGGPGECHPLPIVSGCGDAAVHDELCLREPFDLVGPSCGVRLADGAIFWTEAPPEECRVVNPFYGAPGFRKCTQEEADGSECVQAPDATPRNVEFVITNTTDATIWLMTSDNFCGPLQIKEQGGATLLLASTDACYSNCYVGEGDVITTHAELAQDASAPITWDGLTAVLVTHLLVCAEDDQACEQNTDERCTSAEPKNAPAGNYIATFAYRTEPPPCPTNTEDCADFAGFGVVYDSETCFNPVNTTVSVTFELPESGDLVVPVTIE